MASQKNRQKLITMDIKDPHTAIFFSKLVELGMAKVEEAPELSEEDLEVSVVKENKDNNLIVRVRSLGLVCFVCLQND